MAVPEIVDRAISAAIQSNLSACRNAETELENMKRDGRYDKEWFAKYQKTQKQKIKDWQEEVEFLIKWRDAQ